MHVLLDLDLDFFVWPVAHWPEGNGRLAEGDYQCVTAYQVQHFLEQQCGLGKDARIPGQELVNHEEAFVVWRRWLRDGVIAAPFTVVHVDAHADLGLGDSGWVYLLSELLALPVEQRSRPRHGPDALNSGNYLTFAIANRWIGRLTYVYPTSMKEESTDGSPCDLMAMHFCNQDWTTNLIELRHYHPDDITEILDRPEVQPVRTEPAIPFTFKSADEFEMNGFTHMVVAQSPQFTPASADKLLPVIRNYFLSE